MEEKKLTLEELEIRVKAIEKVIIKLLEILSLEEKPGVLSVTESNN